jgi:hypothetical protein
MEDSTKITADSTGRKSRPRVPGVLRGGVIGGLVLSLAAMVFYMRGGFSGDGLGEDQQFALLRVLRYLSLFVTICSLCAAACCVRLALSRPRFAHWAGLALYLLTGLLGAGLLIANSAIVVAAGGNE